MQRPRHDQDTNLSWIPDWVSGPAALAPKSPSTTLDYLQLDRNNIRLSDVSHGLSSAGSKFEANEGSETDERAPAATDADRVVIDSDKDRRVNRRLGGIHIFMITISGVLGVGLYVRGGVILRLGGPLAVLLSFALLGLLAWGVMQCIAELLCIWPISGALSVYVTEFVDVELGIAVGVAYWFTYAISFAALISATAGFAKHWHTKDPVQGGVMLFLVPIVLVVINAFGIQLYGLIEVVGGTLKLSSLVVVVGCMIAINQGAGLNHEAVRGKIGAGYYPSNIMVHDTTVTSTWAQAFLMSLSIASFAYVGVEITAASALEARVVKEKASVQPRMIGRTVKFSAVYISFFAAIIYVLAGVLVTLNMPWNHPKLPRMSWVPPNPEFETTTSAFVLAAELSAIPDLASVINVFLMFTALSSANTNLYVASRTLFSLTRSLNGGPGQPWYTRCLAYFGKTNNRKVPLRALVASCIFLWVPFVALAEHNDTALETLSQIGSISVIIVWACECWAYIRFRSCIENNRDSLRNVPLVRRWNRGRQDMPDDYPYRSHGQPITAYASLLGCLFILVVANGASLWKKPLARPFLSAYLAPFCFILLWILLKVMRKGQWRLVDLSNGGELAQKMLRLHEIRWRSSEELDEEKCGMQNLWGIL